MSMTPFLNRCLEYPRLSVISYVALIIALCLATLLAMFDLTRRYHAHTTSIDMLERLEGRVKLLKSEAGKIQTSRPSGSPFLEGHTATVASAALLQRITGAITQAGGTIVSTEVEPPGSGFNGYLKAVVTCQLDQLTLQQVLYDLEAGTPFLFVDQLTVNQLTPASDDGRLRVTLGVSGIWTKGQ